MNIAGHGEKLVCPVGYCCRVVSSRGLFRGVSDLFSLTIIDGEII